jgi:hypothetical protein
VPLRGITVTVEGEDRTTTTDSNGQYSFNGLPFGSHELTVEHPKYDTEDKTREIQIRQGETSEEEFTIERTAPVELSIDSVAPDSWQAGDEVTVKYSFDEDVYDTVDFSVDGIISPTTLDTEYGTFEGETTFTVTERQQIQRRTVHRRTISTRSDRNRIVRSLERLRFRTGRVLRDRLPVASR